MTPSPDFSDLFCTAGSRKDRKGNIIKKGQAPVGEQFQVDGI
jgi:hypothetical protein